MHGRDMPATRLLLPLQAPPVWGSGHIHSRSLLKMKTVLTECFRLRLTPSVTLCFPSKRLDPYHAKLSFACHANTSVCVKIPTKRWRSRTAAFSSFANHTIRSISGSQVLDELQVATRALHVDGRAPVRRHQGVKRATAPHDRDRPCHLQQARGGMALFSISRGTAPGLPLFSVCRARRAAPHRCLIHLFSRASTCRPERHFGCSLTSIVFCSWYALPVSVMTLQTDMGGRRQAGRRLKKGWLVKRVKAPLEISSAYRGYANSVRASTTLTSTRGWPRRSAAPVRSPPCSSPPDRGKKGPGGEGRRRHSFGSQ